jgi:quinohemoprotein ethanol dehydrogenase
VYIPANDMPFPYQVQPEPYTVDPRGDYNNGTTQMRTLKRFPPGLGKGALIAWDPARQREVWRINQGDAANGGVLSTAGNLVFQGTTDGYFRAYDARSGKQLWQVATQTSVIAPPVSFRIGSDQFIAVNVRAGGAWGMVNAESAQKYGFDVRVPGRLLVFKLGGQQQLKEIPKAETAPLPPKLAASATPQFIAKGETLYATYCSRCHGPGGVGNTVLPDLRRSPLVRDATLDAILLDGALLSAGMPQFKGVLAKNDVDAIRQYLAQKAREEPTNVVKR